MCVNDANPKIINNNLIFNIFAGFCDAAYPTPFEIIRCRGKKILIFNRVKEWLRLTVFEIWDICKHTAQWRERENAANKIC